MSLVTLREMLCDASERKYAVGAFDAGSYETIRAIVETAEALDAPVILSALKPDVEGRGMDYFTAMAKVAAASVRVPVCIHLDHAVEFDLIQRAIAAGFTSVMIDASMRPFDENVRRTKEVCGYARRFGVTVEAELGHVTDALVGNEAGARADRPAALDDPRDHLTRLEDVGEFVGATGVDALAVAVGTAHGVYASKPVLDFELLERIGGISPVPLVLHGGSGTPDDDIRRTIALGICKINIYSEVLLAFCTTLRDTLNGLKNMASWPTVIYKEPIAAMKEVVARKIALFGSQGKA